MTPERKLFPRLRARLHRRGLDLQFGEERHEALALHHDMRAQPLARLDAISGEQRFHHLVVLVERRREPPAHAQLQTAIGLQLALQIARAQRESAVVRRIVNRAVEIGIGVIIGVDVALLAGLAAALEGGDQSFALARAHAARGKARASRFQLAHEFERFEEFARAEQRDMRAAPRSKLDHAGAGELNERLADRRARDAEAFGHLRLVEPLAWFELAGDDLVLQRLAQADRRFTPHVVFLPPPVGQKASIRARAFAYAALFLVYKIVDRKYRAS